MCTARPASGQAACRRSSERAALATTRRESNNGEAKAFRVSKRAAAATSPRARTRPPAGEGDATPTGEGGNRASAWHAPTYLYADVLYKHAPQDTETRNKPAPKAAAAAGGSGCCSISTTRVEDCQTNSRKVGKKRKRELRRYAGELLRLTVLRRPPCLTNRSRRCGPLVAWNEIAGIPF